MNEHKYLLQPYKGISTRHTCPACKHKNEFTLYIDKDTGKPVHPSVGKCNRETNCGYHYTPSDYFRDYPDTNPKNDRQMAYVPKMQTGPLQQVIDYLPLSLVSQNHDLRGNNLYRFFVSKFGEENSKRVFDRYRVFTSKHWRNNGGFSTAFPQIDHAGRLRQIKVIAYNPETGKRLHKEHHAEKWNDKEYTGDTLQDKVWFAGKTLLNNQNANLRQCFFGEHLIKESHRIGIVESEKTAMIAGLYLPDSVWIATGGKNGCKWQNKDVCDALAGKRVFLYPDLKCLQEWALKCAVLKSYGIDAYVSRYLEEHASESDRTAGLDIGDYFLKEPLPEKVKGIETPELQPQVPDTPNENELRTVGALLAYCHETGMNPNKVHINVRKKNVFNLKQCNN
ncbi:hypothetical protein EZS27_012255 [termite gut metagenome]|uniref:Uncharacterized protein n=1 Tax=termite gut metagenome TaxID=433724 RepID=A0A5J4S155_9ZZZZ